MCSAHLRGARQHAAMSQADLAQRAGISRRTIISIENGHPAELASIMAVMSALGLEMGLRTAPPAAFGLAALDADTEPL